MTTLPLLIGGVHLSVEGGVGGTTFAMQASREVLDSGARVLWTSETLPDGERFSQLFEGTSPIALARFHAMKAGIDLAGSLRSVASLAAGFSTTRLIVVDDWTGRDAQPAPLVQELIESLLTLVQDRECTVLAISSTYEDAAGDAADTGAPESDWPLRARQSARMTAAGFVQAWLRADPDRPGVRTLWLDGEPSTWRLTTEGFVPAAGA